MTDHKTFVWQKKIEIEREREGEQREGAFKRSLSLSRRISAAANSKGAIRASNAASASISSFPGFCHLLLFFDSRVPYCIFSILPREHGREHTSVFDTAETARRRLEIDLARELLCHRGSSEARVRAFTQKRRSLLASRVIVIHFSSSSNKGN